jgi:cytochrome b561
MPARTRFNFVLDAAIFAAFLVTAFTGLLLWLAFPGGRGATWLGFDRHALVDIHGLAGLVVLFGVAWHLVIHWDWILCVARRFLGRVTRQTRVSFSLDLILCALFFATSLSGLIAWHNHLPSGGYHGRGDPFPGAAPLTLAHQGWNDVHPWVGVAMMALLLLHLALHWRWITCMARRFAGQ